MSAEGQSPSPAFNPAALGIPQPGQGGSQQTTGPRGWAGPINPGAATMSGQSASLISFNKNISTLCTGYNGQGFFSRLLAELGITGGHLFDGVAKCNADGHTVLSQKMSEAHVALSQAAAQAASMIAAGVSFAGNEFVGNGRSAVQSFTDMVTNGIRQL